MNRVLVILRTGTERENELRSLIPQIDGPKWKDSSAFPLTLFVHLDDERMDKKMNERMNE